MSFDYEDRKMPYGLLGFVGSAIRELMDDVPLVVERHNRDKQCNCNLCWHFLKYNEKKQLYAEKLLRRKGKSLR